MPQAGPEDAFESRMDGGEQAAQPAGYGTRLTRNLKPHQPLRPFARPPTAPSPCCPPADTQGPTQYEDTLLEPH